MIRHNQFGPINLRERKMPENLTHLESLARAHTDTAIKTLVQIMRNPRASASNRRKAAAVLRRFLGENAFDVLMTKQRDI